MKSFMFDPSKDDPKDFMKDVYQQAADDTEDMDAYEPIDEGLTEAQAAEEFRANFPEEAEGLTDSEAAELWSEYEQEKTDQEKYRFD